MLTKRVPTEKQIIMVKTYLNGRQSIRTRAKKMGIHYITLWRWVKQYRTEGEEGIKRKRYYKISWNRPSKEIEEQVVFLKENDPSCTIRSAKKMLEKYGITMSIRGIWNIWRRYGLAGFMKDKLSNDFRDYIAIPRETEKGIRRSRELIEKGKLKEASKILNQLPSCSGSDILEKIPDKFLSAKRKLEKLPSCFGRIPYSLYRRKARKLKEVFLKKGYFYSTARAGLRETIALAWFGKPVEQLKLIRCLKETLASKKRRVDFPLWFTINILEGIAYARLLETRKALLSLRKCQRFKRSSSNASFLCDLAMLYSHLGYYKEERVVLKKALRINSSENEKAHILCSMGTALAAKGDYPGVQRILRRTEFCTKDEPDRMLLMACYYLGQGKIEMTKEVANMANKNARKMGIMNHLNFTSLLLASAYTAVRDSRKAKLILGRYIELSKKKGMLKDAIFKEVILGREDLPVNLKKDRSVRLVLLLKMASRSGKEKDYWKAYSFAHHYELLGVFHRLVLLIPEPVQLLLEEGKDTSLPRILLKLPIFRKEIPVYYIKLLGNPIVYKNQKYLRVKLAPKETSFLIHLALSRGKRISLDRLYRNFWLDSKNPSRNLAHLLVRIRKNLRLPSHYLYIKEGRLCYDCYFTTDYGECVEYLAQAMALQKAEKWGFAKKEYLRAFKLFRGEPFKKMYDPWSEHMRRVILNELETEAINFAKSCLEHNNEIRQKKRRTLSAKCRGANMVDAKKVLEKVLKIIPNSEEIRKMVNAFG